MPRGRLFTLLACLAAATAVLPATASAGSNGGKLKSGLFQMKISGDQLTTWRYDKVMEPSCDFPEADWGRQHVQFRTYRAGDAAKPLIRISPGKGDSVRPKLLAEEVPLLAEADIERNYEILYSEITPCGPGQGPFGGEDPPADARGTDRCNMLGEVDLLLSPTLEGVEHPWYPSDLPGQKPPRSPFYFAADPAWTFDASDHGLPAACAEDGQPVSIGLAESQREWPGGVIAAVSSVSAKKLLSAKKTKVEFERTVRYPNSVQTYAGPPKTTGKTTMSATITFARVKKK